MNFYVFSKITIYKSIRVNLSLVLTFEVKLNSIEKKYYYIIIDKHKI